MAGKPKIKQLKKGKLKRQQGERNQRIKVRE